MGYHEGGERRRNVAYDPRREDYQRLALRYAQSLPKGDPVAAAKAFTDFGRRFARDRDTLPQSDADRAFHLVAVAAEVIDYQLPFSSEAKADALIARGRDLLDEAVSLDPTCHDAIRMRASRANPSFDAQFTFLSEGAEEVYASCLAARAAVPDDGDDERVALGRDIAMRPYRRWMAALAEEALICGRNRSCIRTGERLLEQDPSDQADVRFTLALAYAKLEDQTSLDALAKRYGAVAPPRAADDAWIGLARLALAHKSHDMALARQLLERLVNIYEGCASALISQTELPDGVFARLAVPPYSEDELILAISEATVLLQEGDDKSGRGVLGSWIARTTAKLYPEALAEAQELSSPYYQREGKGHQGGDAS
jgi:hypothetical protein